MTKTARYLMCITQDSLHVRGFENIPDYIELAKLLPEDQLFTDEWFYKTFDFNWTPTLEVISQGQVQKKYQYLDEDYYSIKDRSKQIKKKKEFIKEFKVFMNNYFKE